MAEVYLSDEALEIVREELAACGEPAPVFAGSPQPQRLREASASWRRWVEDPEGLGSLGRLRRAPRR